MTSRLHTLALSAALLLPVAARAQSLGDRVAAARDGDVRFSYAARAGACGDGRDVVGLGHTVLYVHESMESYGRWSGAECAPGPVRVTLSVHGHAVDRVRVRVGGTAAASDSGVQDLGTVGAPAAADYFLALAGRAESAVAKEAVLAATLADSADVSPGLLRIARDSTRPSAARRRAVHFAGYVGGASVARDLDAIAGRDGDDRKVREAALAALASVGSDASVASLVRFARAGGDEWLQKSAVFWLGQTESPVARRTLRAIIDSVAAPERVRGAAIFALGHGDATTKEDIAYLQSIYGRLESKKLQDQVLMAVAQQPGGGAWLLERARDGRDPVSARKQAIFWAGQGSGDGSASVKELTALYDALDVRELKEQVIFVLSQRDDRAATDQLIAVARNDPDPALRKRALFWLGQKNDPRAAELIRDIVTH